MNSSDGTGFWVVVSICLGIWAYQLRNDVKEANQFAKSVQYLSSNALMYTNAGKSNTSAGACVSSSLPLNECVIREMNYIATDINNAAFHFRQNHGDDTP